MKFSRALLFIALLVITAMGHSITPKQHASKYLSIEHCK
jgi:hypothetical protein